jgi:phage head maturation protease
MSDETTTVEERPHAPVEHRQVADFDVRWRDRIIEMVAMPYDRDADVVVRGRFVTESCAPGAFGAVERRARRVRVNRDHDVKRTVGKVLALHPSRAEGLVAEVRIADSTEHWSLPDETLALAADGILEPSVSFAVMPRGEEWSLDRKRRRLTRLFLDHLAMVPEAAYGEVGGQVLAVREHEARRESERTSVPTPNLDEVRLWLAQDRLGR